MLSSTTNALDAKLLTTPNTGSSAFDRINTFLVFVLLSAFYVASGWVTNTFILTEDVYYETLVEQLTPERIDAFLALQRKWEFLAYVLTPLGIFIKILFTVICLALGATFALWDFKFKVLFRATVVAEVVFVVAAQIQLIWLLYFIDVQTTADYGGFYPLSALNFVTLDEDSAWLAYPLRTLNLFEVFYSVALAFSLRRPFHKPFGDSLLLVIFSYGTGLLLLVATTMFISLQIT